MLMCSQVAGTISLYSPRGYAKKHQESFQTVKIRREEIAQPQEGEKSAETRF